MSAAASRDARPRLRTTVTHLAMTRAPSSPARRPPLLKLALMRAERPSAGFYRYLYDAVGEPWVWWERRQMAPAALEAIVQHERVEIYVPYVSGVPAGFAELDRRSPGVAGIVYFGLIPDFIGRGLGPYLLDWTIRRAFVEPIERLTVQTCTLDHPKALGLYQKAGFVPVKREEIEFADPRVG